MAQDSKKESKNQQKAEQYEVIKELVHAGEFEFKAIRATPQKGSQINLTTRANYLKVSGGNVNADMPYFGVANNAAYANNDGGVMFDGAPEKYQVDENDKKLRVIIKFSVKGKGEIFNCILTIASKDNATLSVTSNIRSAITYSGAVTVLKNNK